MNNKPHPVKYDEQEINDDSFYFESDHLALRGNVDYSEVLKTMFVLEAQRQKAIKDFNEIAELKQKYLDDPLTFIEDRKNGSLHLPPLQHLAEMPKINWSKYPTNVPEQFMRQINSMRMPAKPKEQEPMKNSKSWTPEEQRKLEELLVKYPAEEVDRKRISKIAKELGTRTKEQVASRLQKYFVKLLKAGLPIPGRMPKAGRKYSERKPAIKKPSAGHYHRKYLKPSTFFPDTIIPVMMDDMHAPGPSTSSTASDECSSPSSTKNELGQNNYLLPSSYHMEKKLKINRSNDDVEIELLKWAKAEKMIQAQAASVYLHYGYRCDYCDEDPIPGSRWHCTTCVNNSVDFCTDCILSQFYSSKGHDLCHKFIIIRNDQEVTNGLWSDSDSESDGKSNDGVLSDSGAGSAHDDDCVSRITISTECSSDIFDPNRQNGDVAHI